MLMRSSRPRDSAPRPAPTHADILAATQGYVAAPPRRVAFALLAASDDPDREVVLSRVLENPRECPAVRAAAAIALGHIPTEKAAALLVQALWTAPPEALPDVLRSLGRIGGPYALEVIDRQRASAVGPVSDAARFSGAVIAYRFGLAGHDLPIPTAQDLLAEPIRGERAIEVTPASPPQARAVLASLAHEPYGIELATDTLLQFRCGTATHTVCLNCRFVAPGAAAALLERKALLALTALRSQEGEGHSVSYLILASPSRSGAGIDLLAPLCTGALALAGSAQLVGDEIHFSLRSVDRPGARPLFLAGSVERGRMTIARAAVSKARQSAPPPGHSFRRAPQPPSAHRSR
jgi:hypothetical protein